jgi:hypothetical protein
MTWRVLGSKLAFLCAIHSPLEFAPPQGTGPLPASGGLTRSFYYSE